VLPLLRSDWDKFEDWLDDHGSDILVILGFVVIAYVLFKALFPRVARAAMMRSAHPPDAEMEARADTIIGVVDRTARIALVFVALITLLPEFGVNITAIVTGLGISGLALALGSQQLVRDGINGMFLLAEDQYRTGDVVTIAGVTGTVETITLRRTVLRDDAGVVHSVPNGSITVVANHTRDYAQVNIDVRVSVGQDLAEVREAIEDIRQEIEADSEARATFLDGPRMLRVEDVGENGVTVRVTARTRPTARWDAAGDLRSRIMAAFATAGIKVPYAVVTDDVIDRSHPSVQNDTPL
jgi:small conductance mechanosensitive channel